MSTKRSETMIEYLVIKEGQNGTVFPVKEISPPPGIPKETVRVSNFEDAIRKAAEILASEKVGVNVFKLEKLIEMNINKNT